MSRNKWLVGIGGWGDVGEGLRNIQEKQKHNRRTHNNFQIQGVVFTKEVVRK